jgi:hypothetical protein
MSMLKGKQQEEEEYSYESYTDDSEENLIIEDQEVEEVEPVKPVKKQQSTLRLTTLQKARDAKSLITEKRKAVKFEADQKKADEKAAIKAAQQAKYSATLNAKVKKQVRQDLKQHQDELYDQEILRQLGEVSEGQEYSDDPPPRQLQRQHKQQHIPQQPQQPRRTVVMSQREFLRSLGA